MSSKRVGFASALVFAAFVPQAMGVCTSESNGIAVEKNTEGCEEYYLNRGGKNVATTGDETDGNSYSEVFSFNTSSKKRTTGGGSIFSKVLNRASLLKKRHRKLVDLLKRGAMCGVLGYGVVNFTPPIVDAISKKSALDESLIPSGVDQNVSGLMLNPNIDFGFLLRDVDEEKELSEKSKKESVGDIAKFLSAFGGMYKDAGGNFDVEKFESSIEANFDINKDSARISRFCKNLRSLPRESIAENFGLDGDVAKIVKLLDYTLVREYNRVSILMNENEERKSEYRGFGRGSQDLKRDLYNMWTNTKDVVMEVGGEAMGSLGSSLTMGLQGKRKVFGVIITIVGTAIKYLTNEKKMKDQKNLSS